MIIEYDGKQAPLQWLRCYSIAIEVVGGSYTKAIYFSMDLKLSALLALFSLNELPRKRTETECSFH